MMSILIITSCEKDKFTNNTQLKPNDVQVTITGPSGVVSLVEAETSYTVNIKLSAPQIVNVKFYITQVGGNATMGEDYTLSSNKVVIPAFSTSGSFDINIKSDELLEDTETFTLQVGDDRTTNVNFTPATFDFEIKNVTGSSLSVDMSWATDAADAIGLDLAPEKAVDMRMLIVHADTVYAVVDGAAFESYTFSDADPDGTYLIATDISSTVDAGDFNSPITIDMALEFNQVGTINGMTLSYPAVMTNEFACDKYRTYLAKIDKAGSNYTIDKDVSLDKPGFAGNYSGTDAHFILSDNKTILPSSIVLDGCNKEIFGVNKAWMEEFWGETIVKEGNVAFTIADDGTFTIEEQYIFTTEYKGDLYPYSVQGSGTYDDSGDYPVLKFDYTLSQDGFSPSAWCKDNGYMDTDFFSASVSLEPGFAGLIYNGNGGVNKFKKLDESLKPNR